MQRTVLALILLHVSASEARAAGTIMLSQDSFTVQEKADFSWVYTVGEEGLATGDLLRIYDPVFQGMRWSKWGDLTPWWDACTAQTTRQDASWGLVSVHARRDGERLDEASLEVTRSNCTDEDMSCSSTIHDVAWTAVEVLEGALLQGDEVMVGIGDVGACEASCTEGFCGVCTDCGFEMPDRSFPEVAWPAEFCPVDGDCVALEPPSLEVLSLPTPDLLLATVPSQVQAGAPLRVKVALLDRWGNAVTQATQTLEVHGPEGVQSHTLTEVDGGWHDFELVLTEPGIHRLEVTAGAMRTWTNPVEVQSGPPVDLILWGDIHVHHGYTWVDEDGGTHDLNHDYGRDVVGLDIVSQSQKAEGIEIGEHRLWLELKHNCRAYSVRDSYLVLLGFEWMADLASETYGTLSEGHHNVYYDTCEAPLGTHDLETIDTLDGETGLWSWLAQVEAEYDVRGVTVPHAMRWTGYNYKARNPGTQTLVEVYSEWGDNTAWEEGQLDEDSPGSTQDLMNSGLRLGWIGGSDNHDGWMGNPYSQKNERSGLGAFIATRLSRSAVFDAMQQRHTYATTGHRSILRFRAEDGGHHLQQGTEFLARTPVLRWRYNGTGDVERVRLFRIRVQEGAAQKIVQEWAGDGPDLVGSLDLGPSAGGSVAYWLEIRQWDGETAWSSPIWLSDECGRRNYGAEDPHGRCADEDTGGSPGKAVRCTCTQGAGGAWLWLIGLGLALSRRSGSGSPHRARR